MLDLHHHMSGLGVHGLVHSLLRETHNSGLNRNLEFKKTCTTLS